MSVSNKRSFADDPFEQNITCSTSSVRKRLCISLVPSVPRGGRTYVHKISLNHSTLNINLNLTKLLFYPEEMIFDV